MVQLDKVANSSVNASAIDRTSLTERTIVAGREVFLGRRRGPYSESIQQNFVC
jgi:hypothetical protein